MATIWPVEWQQSGRQLDESLTRWDGEAAGLFILKCAGARRSWLADGRANSPGRQATLAL